MSVLYRAIWSDRPNDTGAQLKKLRDCASTWTHQSTQPTSIPAGRSELDVSGGRARSIEHRVVSEDAFELTIRDQIPGQETVWTTIMRCVARDDEVHTLVENHMVSDDFTLRISVGRPKLVHDLIVAANSPLLDKSRLLTDCEEIPAEAIEILEEILGMEGRSLPVIVCSEPDGLHDGEWLRWAKKIASRTEGVATVLTIGSAAVSAFRARFGDLAIWGGGIRVYTPVPVIPDSEGWHHPYYTRARLEASTNPTLDKIIYYVLQLSARRRVPPVFSTFDELPGLPADALDGMVPATELIHLRNDLEFNLELARDDLSSATKELARARGHLSRLQDLLSIRGDGDIFWGTSQEVEASVPDEVQDVSEAVLAAQTYLSAWITVPDEAAQELDDIDTAETAFVWGNTSWRGFRALAAYAQARHHGWSGGGFWEWCREGPALGWPATPKKLSMTESETVQKTPKLRNARRFIIDREVDSSGRLLMLAHLKISEGGGNLAPRVYFYDDTGGSTGRVHVGLVGPHFLVPNKQTN